MVRTRSNVSTAAASRGHSNRPAQRVGGRRVADHGSHGRDSRHRRHIFALTAITVVLASAVSTIQNAWNRLHPEPYHTSILSGRQWVQELLDGHHDRMQDSLGIRPHVFLKLESQLITLGGLRQSRWVNTTEKLAIFLYQAATNNSIRKVAERFQRSNETVSW